MSEQYRSRLGGEVVRGVGAGHAKNQQVSGSKDPEEDARLASMDPEDLSAHIAAAEEEQANAARHAEELRTAVTEGEWNLPEGVSLEDSSPSQLAGWHKGLMDLREGTEEAEEEDDAFTTLMDPGHPLYNPISDTERRKSVESLLSPLDFEEMIFQGTCSQMVPIRKGFEVEFQTIATVHGLWLEMRLTEIRNQSEQYVRHWFSMLQLSAAIQSMNGKPIGPPLRNLSKEAHKEEFFKALDARMEFLGKMPSLFTDDLIVHYTWFSGRVRKLLAGDLVRKVGN